jgi:hypothetical protein
VIGLFHELGVYVDVPLLGMVVVSVGTIGNMVKMHRTAVHPVPIVRHRETDTPAYSSDL